MALSATSFSRRVAWIFGWNFSARATASSPGNLSRGFGPQGVLHHQRFSFQAPSFVFTPYLHTSIAVNSRVIVMPTSSAWEDSFPGITVENCMGSALNIGGPARRGRGAYVRRMGVHTRQNAREKKKGAESNSESARLSDAGESPRTSWQAKTSAHRPAATGASTVVGCKWLFDKLSLR